MTIFFSTEFTYDYDKCWADKILHLSQRSLSIQIILPRTHYHSHLYRVCLWLIEVTSLFLCNDSLIFVLIRLFYQVRLELRLKNDCYQKIMHLISHILSILAGEVHLLSRKYSWCDDHCAENILLFMSWKKKVKKRRKRMEMKKIVIDLAWFWWKFKLSLFNFLPEFDIKYLLVYCYFLSLSSEISVHFSEFHSKQDFYEFKFERLSSPFTQNKSNFIFQKKIIMD